MGTNFFAVIPVKERTINKLQGITCNFKKTSCGDQLAQALIKIKEESLAK